jgi:hypothetical protein
MKPKWFVIACYGTLITYVGTFIVFFFAPSPLPPALQIWHIGSCVAVTLITIATYFGYPRNLARPLPASMRYLAFIVIVVSAAVWLWLIYRTVFAEPGQELKIDIQRTCVLLLGGGAYYVWDQRGRV